MKRFFLFIAIVALTVSGCASVPVQILQYSPQVNQIDNEYFSLIVTPKRTENLIVGFDLNIKNKSTHNIEIVWEKTLYIDHGQTNGMFWFEGISYSERNSPRPIDIVFPKSTFEKTIWPNKLIYLVMRIGRIAHNPMTEGEHGVFLTTRIKGKEISEKIIFNFSAIK